MGVGTIAGKMTRIVLRLSIVFLLLGVFATLCVPAGTAERLVGSIVVALNTVICAGSALVLRSQSKRKDD